MNEDEQGAVPLLGKIRATRDDRTVAVIRILLGVMFLFSGLAKVLVPMLGDAFSAQLTQANIPLASLNLWLVPVIELEAGVLLAAGYLTRLGALLVVPMMIVAIYVHLVVDDPSLFPLQPEAPVIPLVALAMAGYVLWRGGGAWSLDVRGGASSP